MAEKTLDWYVKWVATILILLSVVFRAAGPEWRMYDIVVGTFGVCMWLWVSILWKDRALIILNAVTVVMLASAFLKEF